MQILDVGCGVGVLSEPLARLGASVVGIDTSNECLEIAQKHRFFIRLQKQMTTFFKLIFLTNRIITSIFARFKNVSRFCKKACINKKKLWLFFVGSSLCKVLSLVF